MSAEAVVAGVLGHHHTEGWVVVHTDPDSYSPERQRASTEDIAASIVDALREAGMLAEALDVVWGVEFDFGSVATQPNEDAARSYAAATGRPLVTMLSGSWEPAK